MKLYHATMKTSAEIILREGFRETDGTAGHGVYFSDRPLKSLTNEHGKADILIVAEFSEPDLVRQFVVPLASEANEFTAKLFLKFIQHSEYCIPAPFVKQHALLSTEPIANND